jgi:RimJ/RimL family protein N-acetyltransferase
VIAFESFHHEHLPVLRDWLAREHVRRWWPDPDDSLGHAEDALAGVDLLIGEEDATGRGLGSRALEQFVREVVFARPKAQACVATVEEANRRSWRAFEKAGFKHVRDVEEDGLRHRLMRLERRYAQ